ncbi:pre-mRNA-processing protein 40A-like [Capsicum annuum]|uniref:pre-mRNA-processing protein 40A-like n=1 Tax=Capsicum annuum TaxID=4072 RepID=UPI001FB1A077|nr:pre-mRNA-processing protein 40A-like [Capsicum annuum]
MSNNHMPGSGAPNLPVSSSYNVNVDSSGSQYQTQINNHTFPSGFSLGQKADASTYWREFTSPGENLHASDFGSISVVKTSSPGADGLLVSAHDAKSSPIAVSPAANLPTIVALESSSLSGNVSSPMIGTVEMKNSSEPALPAVANSEKIGIAVTLGNSVAPPVHVFRFICYKFASGLCCFLFGIQFFCSFETTTTQVTVVYGDGFSSKNRELLCWMLIQQFCSVVVSQLLTGEEYATNSNENVKKDVVITEIGGTTPSDEKIVELGPLVYESKAEEKSTFKTLLESANIGSDCMWNQAMRAVINDRRYGALKSLCEQKQAFNEYLSQKRKLEAGVKQKKAREDFRDCKELSPSSRWRLVASGGKFRTAWKLMKDAPALRKSIAWRFSRYYLFTDVMDELEKQYLDDKSQIKDAVRMAEIGLTLAWMLDDFKVAIAKYISSPPMSDTNLKFVFEELLERAREKEEKEAKKRKCLADEFYELLHEITASSKWEDWKSLFGDRIMGDEGLLLEIFNKFVNELKEKERKHQED